ncbi:MAG: 5-deoxy-glucuronate isomerase [Lactobacillus sp.]|uniref:5-deoxy-glucuronate isomerase n=1 Tax=Bombilactobacillus bombi TaxID=1303590 RepID=UPI0035E93F7C|nr:5-deoxy-glucuronate isomerase [Lactobacillus sp.]
MTELKFKAQKQELKPGITVIQDVTNNNAPLKYAGLKLIQLQKDATYTETLNQIEVCVVALSGHINVVEGEHHFENIGTRDSVFAKRPTDSVYISNDHTYQVTAVTEKAEVVLCYAPSSKQLPTKLISAADNTIEDRGNHSIKRHVHNILPEDNPSANSLLVVEVYTDGGNFSSYPPHRHDHDNLPTESSLEEIYLHKIEPKQGFVFHRVYTDDRSLDETMSVENNDVVVVPKGYHPVGVPDGYNSYYLNVMAGPVRTWKFHNDPDHEWILHRK